MFLYSDAEVRNSTFRNSADLGIFIGNNSNLSVFEGNTVAYNGSGTNQDGIWLYTGELNMRGSGGYAMNVISGNARHEIRTTLGARVYADYGYNTICDTGDPGTVGKYVYEGGTYAVDARDTWWGTTSPTASLFHGTVYYSNPSNKPYAGPCLSSGGSSSPLTAQRTNPAQSSASEALAGEGDASELGDDTGLVNPAQLQEGILAARLALTAGAGTSEGAALAAELFYLQRMDPDDELGEAAATRTLLESYRVLLDTGEAIVGTPLRATAEQAALIGIDWDLLDEKYDAAGELIASYSGAFTSRSAREEATTGEIAVLSAQGRHEEALAVLTTAGSTERDGLMEPLAYAILEEDLRYRLELEGQVDAVRAPKTQTDTAPLAYGMSAAYPNPFNPEALLPFTVARTADVRITVYNLLGQEVMVLADGSYEAGRHTAVLNGERLASGAYVVRAVMTDAQESHVFTEKVTLLK